MPESPIKVVFTYRREEYMRAIRRHHRRRMHLIQDGIVGVVALASGLYLLSLGDSIFGWIALITSLMLAAMVAYALLLLPALIYRWDPKLKNEYRLSFSDDEIVFQTDDIDSVLKWTLYHSWMGDDDFYILYHGKRDLTVLPRRAFTSPEDDTRFAKLLTQKLPPA
ncbi:MAG: YcxB family protein [Acidobacteriota bacterium]